MYSTRATPAPVCHAGMSLVEVLIAMGLTSVVAIAALKFTEMTMNSQNNARLTGEFEQLVSTVSIALKDELNCRTNIGNFQTNKFDTSSLADLTIRVREITLPSGASIAKAGGAPASGGMKISSMQLQGFESLSPSGDSFLARLKITGVKPGRILGSPEMSREIPLLLSTSLSGTTEIITSCSISGLNSASDYSAVVAEICKSMGGTYSITTKRCTLPLAGACPSGQIVTGFNADGSKICGTTASGGSGGGGSGGTGNCPCGKCGQKQFVPCPIGWSGLGKFVECTSNGWVDVPGIGGCNN